MRFPFLAVLLLPFALAVPGQARMIGIKYEPIPIPRLVANVSAYIQQHPDDAEGYYKLARVHSLAFAQSAQSTLPEDDKPQQTVSAILPGKPTYFGQKGLPNFETQERTPKREAGKRVTSKDLFHIRESIRNYAMAVKLAPNDSYSWLGCGWMLEQGAPYASRLGSPWLPDLRQKRTTTAAEWKKKALEAYRKVVALDTNFKKDMRDFSADPNREAGGYVVRILKDAKRPLTAAERTEIQQIEAAIAKGDRPRVISPIIIPLGKTMSLPNLLNSKSSVTFDLASENRKLGLERRWPWIKPNTGILVWDPENTGRITSGRQLFGS
ncbi:hypothetical protein EON80_08205, partial [bacterium]